MDRHRQAWQIAERASGVAATGGVLYQACIAWSKSPQCPIAKADLKLAREDNHPLPARGGVPIDELLRCKLLQANAGCGMKFPKFRVVLWLELLDVGLPICTGE
jgi:hypothetical protein